MEIILTLTPIEHNLLIQALQRAPLPMVETYPLMEKIQQQARQQLQPPPMPETQQTDEESE